MDLLTEYLYNLLGLTSLQKQEKGFLIDDGSNIASQLIFVIVLYNHFLRNFTATDLCWLGPD